MTLAKNTDPSTGSSEHPGGSVHVVRRFLVALEARDLPTASTLLAAGAEMTFPGGACFHRLHDLITWAAPRYRRVAKSFDGFDLVPGAGEEVVYSRGTLSGAWPDGTPFDGIRFIDRFVVRDGQIHRQDVWNDLAEVKHARD
ncbi:MAG: nuclear transport factor 2 family protein [Pseudomonadota bacterium]